MREHAFLVAAGVLERIGQHRHQREVPLFIDLPRHVMDGVQAAAQQVVVQHERAKGIAEQVANHHALPRIVRPQGVVLVHLDVKRGAPVERRQPERLRVGMLSQRMAAKVGPLQLIDVARALGMNARDRQIRAHRHQIARRRVTIRQILGNLHGGAKELLRQFVPHRAQTSAQEQPPLSRTRYLDPIQQHRQRHRRR
jgi:hypothetical protein